MTVLQKIHSLNVSNAEFALSKDALENLMICKQNKPLVHEIVPPMPQGSNDIIQLGIIFRILSLAPMNFSLKKVIGRSSWLSTALTSIEAASKSTRKTLLKSDKARINVVNILFDLLEARMCLC